MSGKDLRAIVAQSGANDVDYVDSHFPDRPLVLRIALFRWTVVILALTVVLSAEMFNQSVKSLFHSLGRPADESGRGSG